MNKTSIRSIGTLLLVVGINSLDVSSQRLSAQEPVVKVPFSLVDFPGLESECLAALEAPDKIPTVLERIESKYDKDRQPEAIRMLAAILRGSDMGMGSGWFGPPKLKRDWNWLAAEQKAEVDGSLKKEDFHGEPMFFDRLDRNGDGVLRSDDFNWGPTSQFMREQGIANTIFRTIDKSRDAKVSKEELIAFFDKARGDNAELGIDAFRRSFGLASASGGYFPGDEPTPERLIRGFFLSELGSLQEGPGIGEVAPDFELSTQDGSQKIRLKDYLGKKPVVLVFGNFTCGPFRRTYPEFDEIGQRYKDRATFFGIYVREAHPDDGWNMESNVKSGVKLMQPKNFDERTAVAKTCAAQLKYSMPLLVDTMDDRVGNLYSGMPARAYVIDADGMMTYQGGRGPFGFRPGEMEQALIMTLMK
ncbi:MAG: deiodinase family protein [Planctomycetota bacterium]|nr:deiodinase family protein [Planctomycetota bacterium]